MNAFERLRALLAGGAELAQGPEDALTASRNGPQPFAPGKDTPQDVGLGGPSTEYLSGAQDPYGTEFNYPTIWWMNGKPTLMNPDAAYDQSMQWENATGLMFPRYRTSEAADFAAQNRSAQGGAEHRSLAGLFGYRNF